MTMKLTKLALSLLTLACVSQANAELATDYGTAKIDLRLRFESVDQDNSLKDASALTLRSLVNFKTKEVNGFSAFVELENTLAIVDDYSDTLGHGSQYSVVADPKSTELDQLYLMYKSDAFSAKVGRQVITFDNHRFVGHVGWRQDKQTFDAVSFNYAKDDVTASYAYIDKRNRIFADEKDIDSKDHLINASLKSAIGKVSAYAYLLEVDNTTNNSLDTYGIRLEGKKSAGDYPVLYAGEFARQSNKNNGTEFDTSYLMAEAGIIVSEITYKLGYESLGSDNGQQAFQTPLATLHKFNGWSDQFLATPNVGLDDLYVSAAGKAFSGKWLITYHDFSADEASSASDDLGSEIDAQFTYALSKQYNLGVKYAAYMDGDAVFGKVDTYKLWLWLGATF